jgi:hypothetical protein
MFFKDEVERQRIAIANPNFILAPCAIMVKAGAFSKEVLLGARKPRVDPKSIRHCMQLPLLIFWQHAYLLHFYSSIPMLQVVQRPLILLAVTFIPPI